MTRITKDDNNNSRRRSSKRRKPTLSSSRLSPPLRLSPCFLLLLLQQSQLQTAQAQTTFSYTNTEAPTVAPITTTSSTTTESSAAGLFDDDKVVDEDNTFDDDLNPAIQTTDDYDDDYLRPDWTPLDYTPYAIDFRDLLLSPEESFSLGGSGLQPYGNVFHQYLWPVLDGMTDPESSMINGFVDTYTTTQSGVAGQLWFPTPLGIEYDIMGTMLFLEISNIKVEGLDNLRVTKLLHPTDQPHILHSSAVISDVTVSMQLQVALDGPTELLRLNNTVEITLRVPRLMVSFDLMVLLDARKLFSFPINNLLEIPCWMGLLLDTSHKEHESLELQNFQVELGDISLTVECIDCSDMLDEFLPQLMGTLQDSLNEIPSSSTTPAIGSGNSTAVEVQTITNTITAPADSLVTNRLETLLEDAVYNLWELISIESATAEATKLCPHHDDYDPDSEMAQIHADAVFGLEFGLFAQAVVDDTIAGFNATSVYLSRDSFETVLAAGLVGVETVMVLAAQRYLFVHENSTAFSPTVFIPPPNTTDNYLNWTNLEEEAGLLHLALEATKTIDPQLVNDLLEDNLLDDNQTLVIPLDLTINSAMGHILEVYQVVVYGINTVVEASLLVPISAYQLRSEILWEHVAVTAYVNISGSKGQYPEETVALSLSAYDMAVLVDVLVPIDVNALGEVPLGGVLQNEFNCLVSVVQNSSVANLQVSIGEIGAPQVEGYLSEDLEHLVNAVGGNLIEDFGDDLAQAVPLFFQTTVRSILNDLLYQQVSFEPDCSVVVPQPPGFMDFQDLLLEETPYGSILSSAYKGLNNTFFNQEGVNKINEVIGTATSVQSNTSGVLDFLTDFAASFSTGFSLGDWTVNASGGVSNISLTNLDSLGLPFAIAWPEEPWVLDTNLTMGTENYYTNATQPLTVSADLVMQATDGLEMNIYNDIRVTFGIIDMQLWISILLKITELAFMYFPLKAAGNLNCWLLLVPPKRPSSLLEDTKLPGVAFDIFFDYYNATVGLDCVECTSPLLPEMIEEIYRIGENNSELLEDMITNFVTGDFLQTTIDGAVRDAQSTCLEAPEIYSIEPQLCREVNSTQPPVDGAGNDSSDSEDSAATTAPTAVGDEPYSNWTNFTEPDLPTCDELDAWKETLPPAVEEEQRDPNATFFNIGFATFSVVILICFIIARIMVHYRNKQWMKSLPPQGAKFLKHLQEKERERDEYLDETMSSLYHSVFIPGYIRVAVPIVIVLNMALFVVAHMATSIRLSIEVNFGGDYFMIDDLFAFNFRDGLVNTFANGGYEMAILLLIFGGIWPYFRCILSLILWFTPPHFLSSEIRGRMFLWIDAMNKLTVRDIFKFMIIIAIFFVYVGGPYVFNEGRGDLYSLRALGWPGPALYCGITAMIISRVSSRLLLAYHYVAVNGAREAYHKDRVGDIPQMGSNDTDESIEFCEIPKISREKSSTDKLTTGSNTTGSSSNHPGDPPTKVPINQGSSTPLPGDPPTKIPINDGSRIPHPGDPPTKIVEVPVSDSESEEQERESSEEGDRDDDEETDSEEEGERGEVRNEGERTIKLCGKEFLLGNVSMVLGLICVVAVLIVGLVYIPAVSIDLSAILELFLESGTTYEQAISEFGVYSFICAIVLKARLAVESTSDYVAVVLLLGLGVVLISFTFLMDVYRWICDVITNGWRRLYPSLLERDEHQSRERNLVMMPSYLRLKAAKYSTVYVLAYVLGIYQLGAVTIYAIHYFCNALDTVYGALSFIGLIEITDGQCWEAQMSQYHNIIVLFGCFFYLTFMFFEQIVLQRKANVAEARKFLQELQEERAWEEENAKSEAQAEADAPPPRRIATVGSSRGKGKPLTGSSVSGSEGPSGLASTDGDSSSSNNNNNHDMNGQFIGDSRFSFADPRYSDNGHDLDGQFIGDSRFSFADPRYSFNDPLRPSYIPSNTRISMFHDEASNGQQSELTTITEPDAGEMEDSSHRPDFEVDEEDEELLFPTAPPTKQEAPLQPPPAQPAPPPAQVEVDCDAVAPSPVEVDCDLSLEDVTATKEGPIEFDV